MTTTHQPPPAHGHGLDRDSRRHDRGGTAAAQTATAAPLRILLLNPNSSPDFTRIIAAEARRVGSPGTEFVEVTAPFGPRYIGTRATIAIAATRPSTRWRRPWPRTSGSTLPSWPDSARKACRPCRRSPRFRWSTC